LEEKAEVWHEEVIISPSPKPHKNNKSSLTRNSTYQTSLRRASNLAYVKGPLVSN